MDHNSQKTSTKLPQLLLSGLDSLYVSYYLDGLGFDWEDLDYRKEQLKQDRRQDFINVTLGGKTWALMPYGKYPYQYVLRNAFFQIFLAKKNSPSCYIQFLSQGLWTKGTDWLHSWLLNWFEDIGCRQTRIETVARADFAYDFDLPLIDFTQDDFVSRAKKDNIWRENREFQSFIFGSGAIVVRVYDKIAEIMQQSEKHWFYDLWGQDKDVWRVEFQTRRPQLKKIGINSLKELHDFKGDILRELATNHTSLRNPTEDSNRSRWPYHPLWQSLLKAVGQENQTGLIETFQPENGLNYVLLHQLRSLYGDLKGLSALLSVIQCKNEPLSLDMLIEEVPKLLQGLHHPILWANDVQNRIDKRRMGK